MISIFRREADESFFILGHYAGSSGHYAESSGHFHTDISGQPNGFILNPEDGTCRLSRNSLQEIDH